MKKIFGFWNLLLLASVSVFMASCGDDTIDPVDQTSPTLTETHNFDEKVDQDPNNELTITLKAVKGVGNISSLNVKENGVNLDPSRFELGGDAVASSTVAILGADQQGFVKEFDLVLPTVTGTYTYLFTVTDANQKTDQVSVEIKVKGLSTVTSEKLYNFAGPLASGLNLSTGKAVAKNTDNNTWPGAHILDAGNDLVGTTNPTYPWKGSITNYDGSIIRKVASSVWTSSIGILDVKVAFESSSDLVVAKLAVGDVYVVKKGEDYFLIKVKSVVDDGMNQGGSGSNVDYSEFEIKN